MILRYLARLILFFMGWSPISQDVFTKLEKYNRQILIFSHTSYMDFYILLLYLLAYPYRLRHVKVLIKPQPFRYAGWLLRYFGGIPATKVDNRNGGAVARIIQELDQYSHFLFLISPKGTIVKSEWRSGYYHIATSLNSPMMVVGLDYEQHMIKASMAISSSMSESVAQVFLKEKLSTIVPLYPEDESVPIRPHKPPTVISFGGKIRLCLLVLAILWRYNYSP